MTTWVLLRGWAREARHWGDFASRLARQVGAGDRVLALDLPGNGVLHRQASPASVAALAAACRAELARQSVAGPYVPVAMSLGAMVALQWSQAASAEVAGCVLINTSVRGHGPFWERLRPRNYLRLMRLLWPASLQAREEQVLALTSGDPARHGGLPAQWARIARQHPVSWRNALRQLWAAAHHASPGRPTVPVLLLASAGDRLVSHRCSERLAACWNLPLALHPHAGHDLPLDDPEWVLAQISAWWQGPKDPPRG